jgi:hypothetical protein
MATDGPFVRESGRQAVNGQRAAKVSSIVLRSGSSLRPLITIKRESAVHGRQTTRIAIGTMAQDHGGFVLTARSSQLPCFGQLRFKPTARQRKEVMQCVAMKMRPTQIANAFGIDEDIFVKHFSREIKLGPMIMRQWLLAAIAKQAIKGKKRSIALLAKMWVHQPPRRRLRAR